jgi:hypothetical protein
MNRTINIKVGAIELKAALNNSTTAGAVWDALPFESRANLWGDEIYFSVPLSLELENGQETVQSGDLGYWPTGNAFCIFFGPTPASRGNEIRPASAVTVLGKIAGDATVLKQVTAGTKVTVERETGE